MIDEILRDTKALLESDPRLAFVKRAGGITIIGSIDEWEMQRGTPAILLVDPGGHAHKHLSSYVRDSNYALEVWVVQRNFTRQDLQAGSESEMSIGAVARIVVLVMDMIRHGGKYANIYLTGESKPTPIKADYPQLQGKALTFDVRRIESPS